MACSIHFLLPAAYYLAVAFEKEPTGQRRFEQAVLHAINSGGNNMARAALTGEQLLRHVGARRPGAPCVWCVALSPASDHRPPQSPKEASPPRNISSCPQARWLGPSLG